jgi:hypothetical protein
LLLNCLLRCPEAPCISDEKWFEENRQGFRRYCASGANLNPVRERFEHYFHETLNKCNIVRVAGLSANADAIDDSAPGNDHPERSLGSAARYARDPELRAAVIKRAKGKCEYCQKDGFICDNGKAYLESHHIIALANDGKDRMENVIALCANDHRQAHFGKDWEEIEQKMIEIVKELEARRRLEP